MDSNKGLTTSEALSRAAYGQSNGGAEIKTKSCARIICENIFTFFNLINAILAVMVIAVGSLRNALFMGVVICNTAIGIFQAIRAKRAIDRLSIITAPKARVIRDGEEKLIPVEEVVTDDIMVISAGVQVCADACVLEGECETDESLITGESDNIFKKAGDELYSGSFVVSGHVTARAVRVGKNSASGRITSGSKYIKKTNSEMMRSINVILKLVSVCIFPFGAVLFYKAFVILKHPLGEAVTSTTAALIGMIPEGLVLLTGIALAISAIRLSRRDSLCRDLYCVEALARADVLCLDKTGTLTEGCMEVAETVTLDRGYDDNALEEALSAFVNAFPERNSTLKALDERYGGKAAPEAVNTVPFSSARKWSAAEIKGLGTLVLGAPEIVCGNNARISEICAKYAENGIRTLIFAHSSLPLPADASDDRKIPELPLRLSVIALIALSDKLRPSAKAALGFFKQQGVDVKVISGDAPAVVSRIAERAGLENAHSCIDMSGVADGEIQTAAESYTVFGRTSPEQKLKLIKALRSDGHRTAMVGDGVNDVMALRESDCGIAMGAAGPAQSGSDAVRAVSQIVLINSDLSALPLAVREGRRCVNNIRRSASLFLTKTIFSFLLTAVYLFLPLNYPFKPIQLTLISAVMIGIPSFLLALEANTKRISGGFTAHIFKRSAAGGISAVVGVLLLTVIIVKNLCSISPEEASTMAVIITAAAFFGTLFHICRPLSRLRAAMLVGLAAMFSGAALLFPGVFYLVSLNTVQAAILVVLCMIVILTQTVLRVIFNKIKLKD